MPANVTNILGSSLQNINYFALDKKYFYNKDNDINILLSDMKNVDLPPLFVVHATTSQAMPNAQPVLLRAK